MSACWGEVSAVASPQPCLCSIQTERGEPTSVFKDNLTLCNHSCLGFDLREGRRKIITCFLRALSQWMKGNVRFESYGNGRLSVRVWWGGVECYLREIKQDPLRYFFPRLPALKASGNLPHSASAEHRGGVRKQGAGGLTLSSPQNTFCFWEGRTHWLADWVTEWLTALHFKVPPLILFRGSLGKMLLFCAGPLSWASPCDLW